MRIEKILQKFDVDQITLSENFRQGEIRLTFVLKDTPVSIPVNYAKLASVYYPGFNWDHLIDSCKKKVKNASYAALEDYLKAMLTMHQLEIMELTEIFLPNLIGKDGIRMADMIQNRLPEFLEGKLLGDGR